jgi:hypothetical protein
VRPMLDITEIRSAYAPLALVLWPEWPALWDGPIRVSGDTRGTGWLDTGHYCTV